MSNQRKAPLPPLPHTTSADDTSHLKQERAIHTRKTILDAAASVFAETGFPAVTIKDVADKAELTKGAVYFHFTNKEAIAVAVADEFYRRLNEIIAPVLEHGDPAAPQTVVDVLMAVAGGFRDDDYVKAGSRLQIERPYIKGDMPVPYVGFTDLLTELLENCHKAGTLRATDPAALARVLRAALFGAQHISWVQANRQDVVDRVQEIIDVFLTTYESVH
ncbi:ScbR family autoregulator-binding transcription factor [Streptomyces sp. G5(2025)]|uniref:ScbR family autoregulator-binding transcription factor n=1 Tax=Streptomyces sp. G5(2025) TaxID=3406628 RepID=UPI003C233732